MIRRRMDLQGARPPRELLVFDPADWVAELGEDPWYSAFRQWCAACSEWVAEHGNHTALGSPLDLLRQRVQAKHCRAAR